MPFYCESKPDQFGYIANPQGFGYVDYGVGGMLSSSTEDPDLLQWKYLAPLFNGKFLVPTLRNVDMRPRANFTKAYMHNGYLKSLKEVVHFYNTSQELPRCAEGSKGEKVTCWPAPEVPQNVTTLIGNLGLTDEEAPAYREAPPSPRAKTSGMTPSTMAAVVIRIGRSRTLAAATIASRLLLPLCCSSFATSTIRMPCLLMRPIKVTSPTWV